MAEVPRRAEKMGSCQLFCDSEGQWSVDLRVRGQQYTLSLGSAGATTDPYDLGDTFQSPGQALDAAIRWAAQRGLELEVGMVQFVVYRPAQTLDSAPPNGV